MTAYLLLLVAMLLLSGFFSGAEIGFLSSNKFKIALGERQGHRVDQLLNRFLNNNARFISTILIGNNLALVLYGIATGRLFDPLLQDAFGWTRPAHTVELLAVQTLLSTSIVLLFGEYLPKALFRAQPIPLMRLAAVPMHVFYVVLKPAVYLTERASKFLLRRVFRLRTDQPQPLFTKSDLFRYFNATLPPATSRAELDIDPDVLKNAMDFNATRIREFMIPRTELVALHRETDFASLKAKFIETELSRILIFDDSLDNVRGYVHVSALFRDFTHLSEVLQPLLVVPESMAANTLLTEFHDQRRSVALVVDEFGGTAGLVTIEDLVEVILGDIEDEHDPDETEELLAREVQPGTWQFSGRWEVEDLNHTYGFSLPEEEGDYTTLAGLVLHVAERIPAVKESLLVGPYRITVMKASRNKLEILQVAQEADQEEVE